MDEITKRLIEWLKEYFHGKLLINAREESEEQSVAEASDKAGAILFTVLYFKGYKELWLLNEGGQKGCDRILTKAQYDEIHNRNPPGGPYNPIYLDIKLNRPEEGDRIVWRFEGEEVVDGTAGAGYEGTIVYDKATQSFGWDGPIMQTWIA